MECKLAVCGQPINHSKSPQIFEILFKEYSISAKYDRWETSNPNEIFKKIKTNYYQACNITAPLKSSIVQFADEVGPLVKEIGVSNLLLAKEGKIYAHNTDCFGIEKQFSAIKPPADVKVLILGGGATSRSIAFVLGSLLEIKFFILRRNFCKSLFDVFKGICESYVIISTLPRDINPLPLITPLINPSQIQYFWDANYDNLAVKKTLQANKINYYDGIPWLVWQAIESFKLIFQQSVPTKLVLEIVDIIRD